MLSSHREAGHPRAVHSIFERASFAFVLLVWLGGLIATHVFIATYASRTAFGDDVTLFGEYSGRLPFWGWLWSLHNEHRLVVPKALQLALYHLTGDIRSGMYVQAEIYAATALACVLMARKLRGGSRPWDAFFPLMWLQIGNSGSLLVGFDLCIAIPTACVCVVLFMSVFSPMRLWPSRALASGLALLMMPLCGGPGMLNAPVLAAWAAWLGWKNRASAEVRERMGARLYLSFGAMTLALVALYMIGFHPPRSTHYDIGLESVMRTAIGALSMAFGPSYERWWPVSGWILVPLATLGVLAIGREAIRSRANDAIAIGTLAVLTACVCLLVGIGYGRPTTAGRMLLSDRYFPLAAPFFVTLSLGSLALLGTKTRELALAACFVAMVAATPRSVEVGRFAGYAWREDAVELDRLVSSGARADRIREYYRTKFFPMASHGWWPLDYFAEQGLPPFDRVRGDATARFDPAAFEATRFEVESTIAPATRMVDGELWYCVSAGTTLRFHHDEKSGAIGGWMGAPKLLIELGLYPGLRVQASLCDAVGRESEIGHLAFDPVHMLTDRGMRPFEFRWKPGTSGRVLLRFEAVDPSAEGLARSWVKLRDLYVEDAEER